MIRFRRKDLGRVYHALIGGLAILFHTSCGSMRVLRRLLDPQTCVHATVSLDESQEQDEIQC